MDNKPLKPAETLEVCINTGVAKAGSSFGRLVVNGQNYNRLVMIRL